jgi:hypothetical protein
MTHSDIAPDRQAELGITPAMIRLSVGVEHPADLIADLTQALEAVCARRGRPGSQEACRGLPARGFS